jgi:hypothetical protein
MPIRKTVKKSLGVRTRLTMSHATSSATKNSPSSDVPLGRLLPKRAASRDCCSVRVEAAIAKSPRDDPVRAEALPGSNRLAD